MELVGEGIRHTKAWPGAPNALSARMKRLAPALRGIGIEYGEDRSGSKGTRRKTLTKKESARDRRDRQHRQSPEEDLQNGRNRTDDSTDTTDDADGAFEPDCQRESAANRGVSDDADGSDDALRPDSKGRGSWQSDPMRHYGRGGAP